MRTDRVILTSSPEDEIRIVNQIYHWFIDQGLTEPEIAGRLNGMKVRTDLDRDWTRTTVHEVITNEKYISNNIYNRISFKLKKLRVINVPDMWIKKEGAFESVVPPDVFYTARASYVRAKRYLRVKSNCRCQSLKPDPFLQLFLALFPDFSDPFSPLG